MDTSEQYIKMCGAAEEIQAMRAPDKNGGYPHFTEGDFFAAFGKYLGDSEPEWKIEVYGTTDCRPCRYEKPTPHTYVFLPGFEVGDGYNAEKIIWLPRLDQLIKIANDDTKNAIMSWKDEENPIEMTWLSIAMQEKFNKFWNGEKWS